jgi:hypothetical protein
LAVQALETAAVGTEKDKRKDRKKTKIEQVARFSPTRIIWQRV